MASPSPVPPNRRLVDASACAIVRAAETDGYRMSAFIVDIVKSDAFRMQSASAVELNSEHLSGPRALADLASAFSQARQLIKQRENLSQRFQLDAIEQPGRLREEAVILKTTGLLGRLLPSYRKAKRSWISIARSGNSENRSRMKTLE